MLRKFFKNLFGSKDEVVTTPKLEPAQVLQEPTKEEPVIVEEPVKVIEERLAEVAEKKVVTAKEIKGKVKKTPVTNDVKSDVAPEVKKPRRKRKPKPKTDKPADGESK